MKKLVNTPISNTIWWAAVNEDASEITGNREDVTDNALEVVLQHLTGMSNYAKEKFAGYDFTQKKTPHSREMLDSNTICRWRCRTTDECPALRLDLEAIYDACTME